MFLPCIAVPAWQDKYSARVLASYQVSLDHLHVRQADTHGGTMPALAAAAHQQPSPNNAYATQMDSRFLGHAHVLAKCLPAGNRCHHEAGSCS